MKSRMLKAKRFKPKALINKILKKPKFRNKITYYQGLRFDSKLECNRYKFLQKQERLGHIYRLERQVKFLLRNGAYIADFTYYVPGKGLVVEDTKSKAVYLFQRFHLRQREFKNTYGIPLKVVYARQINTL